MEAAILATGLFFFLAHLFDAFFQRTRIPDILLLTIVGALLGPIFHLIPEALIEQVGAFLSTLTLIVILTESGLNLDIKQLVRSASRSLPFAVLAFSGSVAVIALLCHFALGLDLWSAIMAGAILGGTSSSVVIPILKNLGAGEDTALVLTIESALTDVLCIIGAIGIATALASGEAVQAGGLLGGALVSLIGASLYGGILGMVWAVFLAVVKRLRNGMFTTLAFALVVYGSAEIVGISGAIAALAFGVALGNVPASAEIRTKFWDKAAHKAGETVIKIKHITRQERRLYAEVVFLLKAFFFVYLGTRLRLESFASLSALFAFALALVVMIPRYPLVRWMLDSAKTSRRDALLAVSLAPRGMAAAVLAQVPVQMGIPNTAELADVVTMMVFFSITITAVLVFTVEKGIFDRLAGWVFPASPLHVKRAPAAKKVVEPAVEAAVEPAPEPIVEPSVELVVETAPEKSLEPEPEPAVQPTLDKPPAPAVGPKLDKPPAPTVDKSPEPPLPKAVKKGPKKTKKPAPESAEQPASGATPESAVDATPAEPAQPPEESPPAKPPK